MNMEAKAVLRSTRISPQKARLVADQVRNLPVARALGLLKFSDKKAAQIIYKVIYSATSNAENNNGLKPETLRVKEAVAGTATTLKRMIPKARGSAGRSAT